MLENINSYKDINNKLNIGFAFTQTLKNESRGMYLSDTTLVLFFLLEVLIGQKFFEVKKIFAGPFCQSSIIFLTTTKLKKEDLDPCYQL